MYCKWEVVRLLGKGGICTTSTEMAELVAYYLSSVSIRERRDRRQLPLRLLCSTIVYYVLCIRPGCLTPPW